MYKCACADALARRGALLSQDFVVYLEPLEVFWLLNLDDTGVLYNCFVNSSGAS